MEPQESSRDGRSPNFLERLIEVSEKSLVLDHGILLQSNGLALELVSLDISTELPSTTRSTESDQEQLMELLTMLTAKMT